MIEARPDAVEVDYGRVSVTRSAFRPMAARPWSYRKSLGETARTLKRQREAETKGSKTLAICNVKFGLDDYPRSVRRALYPRTGRGDRSLARQPKTL